MRNDHQWLTLVDIDLFGAKVGAVYGGRLEKQMIHALGQHHTTDHTQTLILQCNRVPKCDVIGHEICEIMGFVKIF